MAILLIFTINITIRIMFVITTTTIIITTTTTATSPPPPLFLVMAQDCSSASKATDDGLEQGHDL